MGVENLPPSLRMVAQRNYTAERRRPHTMQAKRVLH